MGIVSFSLVLVLNIHNKKGSMHLYIYIFSLFDFLIIWDVYEFANKGK